MVCTFPQCDRHIPPTAVQHYTGFPCICVVPGDCPHRAWVVHVANETHTLVSADTCTCRHETTTLAITCCDWSLAEPFVWSQCHTVWCILAVPLTTFVHTQNVFRIVRSFGASIANYHIITNFEYSMGPLPSNNGSTNGATAPWTMFEPMLPREPQLN